MNVIALGLAVGYDVYQHVKSATTTRKASLSSTWYEYIHPFVPATAASRQSSVLPAVWEVDSSCSSVHTENKQAPDTQFLQMQQ